MNSTISNTHWLCMFVQCDCAQDAPQEPAVGHDVAAVSFMILQVAVPKQFDFEYDAYMKKGHL